MKSIYLQRTITGFSVSKQVQTVQTFFFQKLASRHRAGPGKTRTTAHNYAQLYTTTHNYAQLRTTTHNHAQLHTIVHNCTQQQTIT